jgi:hypothetical protein
VTDTLFNSDTFVADNPFASARVKPLFDRPPKLIPAPRYPDGELWLVVCKWLRVVGFIPSVGPMQADEPEVVNESEATAEQQAWLAEYQARDIEAQDDQIAPEQSARDYTAASDISAVRTTSVVVVEYTMDEIIMVDRAQLGAPLRFVRPSPGLPVAPQPVNWVCVWRTVDGESEIVSLSDMNLLSPGDDDQCEAARNSSPFELYEVDQWWQ